MKYLFAFANVIFAFSAFAVTATKEYVDRKIGEVEGGVDAKIVEKVGDTVDKAIGGLEEKIEGKVGEIVGKTASAVIEARSADWYSLDIGVGEVSQVYGVRAPISDFVGSDTVLDIRRVAVKFTGHAVRTCLKLVVVNNDSVVGEFLSDGVQTRKDGEDEEVWHFTGCVIPAETVSGNSFIQIHFKDETGAAQKRTIWVRTSIAKYAYTENASESPVVGWVGTFSPAVRVWAFVRETEGGGAKMTKDEVARLVTADDIVMSPTDPLAVSSAIGIANNVASAASDIAFEAKLSAGSAKSTADDALAYSSGIFNYMNANTNAWFAGTNYVVGAQAATRHKFAFEPGMDLASVPCSMALLELRDGAKSTVWDQRDWVSWYWSFKSSQMMAKLADTNAAIRAEIAARAPAAWSQRTAATGLVNPDATTTWIDTEKVVLSPGMAWETVAEVGGCAYWTIVGRGTIGGSAAENVLTIKDFEGKPVLKIKKGESYQAYLECGSEIYTSGRDDRGRVTFTMRATVKPTAEFSTTLEADSFVTEDDENCPAAFEWENVSAGVWRIHFLVKPTISANACFAKFKVDIEGETTVEYTASQTITGGLIYNGVKIAPVVTKGAAVGTTVTWKVVQ